MIFKAFEAIKNYEMLANTKKVVVGFSGGADSTALLHFLHFFASKCGKIFTVEAVHVNHSLRGQEAIRDENFTKTFCEKHGIKITIKRVNIKKIAKDKKISLEEAGRLTRYKIFKELAYENSTKIATAHTLSDSCETLLLNLTRGCSLKGLCGIPAKRDNIIRPLINVTREEIEKYCTDYNLKYITDSSNLEQNYTRNKIRLSVIPVLKSINPNFENTVARTLRNIASDEKYLENQAKQKFEEIKTHSGYNIFKLCALPYSLKSRVVFKILKQHTTKLVEQKHIDLFEEFLTIRKKVTLFGDLILSCEDNNLKIFTKKNTNSVNWQYPLQKYNSLTEIKTNIIIKVVPFLKFKHQKSCADTKNLVDFEKLPKNCVIRNRKAGDIFSLPVRSITKSVKKLMNELKIPQNIRNNIALIASGNEVIWIDGVGVSKKYIPDEKTNQIAIIVKE